MTATDCLSGEREKRLMAMGQMAASLAHEIRNPLGSMELFCSLLKRDLAQQPEQLYLAEQVYSGIQMLNRIISNCLQFSRDITPARQHIADLKAFIAEVCVLATNADASAGIDTEFLGEHPIFVDKTMLQQAIINLLRNACEAAASAQQAKVSLLSDTTDPSRWRFEICDNGPGIEADKLSRVFDPFYSTKSSGTGLGLPIVYGIITAHGGNIEIKSATGEGTCVQVQIPHEES